MPQAAKELSPSIMKALNYRLPVPGGLRGLSLLPQSLEIMCPGPSPGWTIVFCSGPPREKQTHSTCLPQIADQSREARQPNG